MAIVRKSRSTKPKLRFLKVGGLNANDTHFYIEQFSRLNYLKPSTFIFRGKEIQA